MNNNNAPREVLEGLEKFFYRNWADDTKPGGENFTPLTTKPRMVELGITTETLTDFLDIPPLLARKILEDPTGEHFALSMLTREQAQNFFEFALLFTERPWTAAHTDVWLRFIAKILILVNRIPFEALAKLTEIEPESFARYLNPKSQSEEDLARANGALTDYEKLRVQNLAWRFYFCLNRREKPTRTIHHLDGFEFLDKITPVAPVKAGDSVAETNIPGDNYELHPTYGPTFKPYMAKLGFELIASEWQ